MRARFPGGAGSRLRAGLALVALMLALPLACRAEDPGVGRRLAAGDIIVSSQSVPGSSVKRAEMTAIVKAPPEVVWQIITDINNFKYFMPRTESSRAVAAAKIPLILQKHPSSAPEVEKLLGPTPATPPRPPGGKYIVYHYSELNLPWPCENRWYINKCILDESHAAQHEYRLTWSLVTGNLKENSGEWVLKPYGAGQTKVMYRLSTDPGGAIPGFLVKRGTCVTLPQMMEAIRERAAKICRVKASS